VTSYIQLDRNEGIFIATHGTQDKPIYIPSILLGMDLTDISREISEKFIAHKKGNIQAQPDIDKVSRDSLIPFNPLNPLNPKKTL
jgi:hypothetical protein